MASTTMELLLDQAHSAVISMDEEGLVTYWNPAAALAFGIASGVALGRPVAELIIPERFRDAHWAGLKRFLADGVGPLVDWRVEVTALRSDGSEFPVEMTISVVREDAERKFTAFVQDISVRREMEREQERLVKELRRTLRVSERRFDAVVGSLSDPVTIRDRGNRIVYANRAALAQLGFESLDELRVTAPEEIMAGYAVLDEDGQEVSMEQIPSVMLLRGQAAKPLVIRAVNRETRAERWSVLKASPILNDGGELEATITVIEDVTEQKRGERRAAFLAEASRVLASSLDYEQTLRNVAQLAVPDVVDWCAVDLMDASGDRIPVAVAHVDPARLALAEELRAYQPGQLDSKRGLGRVFRTGETTLYPEITDEMLVEGAVDERHLELLRSVGFRSAVLVPMLVGARTLGALTMVSAESGRVLERFDVELAEQVAARAAVAIENSRVYSERSKIAHTLQQSLLPDRLPQIPGYELASAYIPALESAEVGGDFYDVWQVGGGWVVTIGDVTGKGAEAAALTSMVRYSLRATAEFLSSPAEILSRLDRMLKSHHADAMCTALVLRLQDDRVTLAIGGHPLPIYLDASGARQIGEPGPLLGALDSAEWRDCTLELAPQCTLLLYTDGVTDAVGEERERYGLTRLQATLDRCRELPASRVTETLIEALRQFQVGEHADDTAVLALRRLPAAQPDAAPQLATAPRDQSAAEFSAVTVTPWRH